MITEWLIALAVGVADWFLGIFPAWTVPAEIAGFDDTVNGFTASFTGLGVWVPWTLLIVCIGITLGAVAVNWIVKAARWVLGLVPTMGGGT